mgnify:CR=1 FL=1
MAKSKRKIDWHQLAIIGGVILLLAGLQFRFVKSFICTPETTVVLMDWFGPDQEPPRGAMRAMLAKQTSHRHAIEPPRWLGLATIATASVLLCYGAMGKLRQR